MSALLPLLLACGAPAEKDPSAHTGGAETGVPAEETGAETGETGLIAETGETGAETGETGAETGQGGETGDTASHTGGGPTLSEDAPPGFELVDLNPNSPRYEDWISPRDYLEEVSGWYFTHAT